MRDPILAFAEWAFLRSPTWRQMKRDLDDCRIGREIDRVLLETSHAAAVTQAKVQLVDELKAALEARNAQS